MRVPRIRIAWIMAAVVFAALDFAGIRALDDLHGGKILMLGALPIANVLVASLLVGYLRSEDRAFYTGVGLFGTIALTSFIALEKSSPGPNGVIGSYLQLFFLILPPKETLSSNGVLVLVPGVLLVIVLMLGGPQLAFALIGGLLSRRFWTGITRH